jgi:prefoldin alpha subunit
VIVDIGTGYYVSKVVILNMFIFDRTKNLEQTRAEASKYYQSKVDFITTNLNTLQTTIETKQQNMNYLLQV